jgi:hypothetical protein
MIFSPGMTIDGLEKELIQSALKFYQGNKTVTARSIGCALRTLDNKLAQYAEEERLSGVERDAERAKQEEWQKRARGINGPHSGVQVEPPPFSPQKLDVSLQVGSEVQKVLPTKVAERGARKAR